ncbi:MAG: hypothetical protein UV24_C0030G0004 [Candidatus Nomurabacteria bacterium GW2011_GWA2_42_41]|nr:MAG: hypothetical protein UV24_C0030G0004 [Candidatus Nomurabacteria bacterium GW2011_GWA2_42_41]
MILEDQQIEELRKLYLKECGMEISFDEAKEKAIQLIGLYKAIYLPELIDKKLR